MTFTKEQLDTLSKWEDHFHTAINADWARNPGRIGMDELYDTLHAATGDNRSRNYNCQSCILHLLQDVGRIYYKDKAEIEALKAKPVKKTKAKK